MAGNESPYDRLLAELVGDGGGVVSAAEAAKLASSRHGGRDGSARLGCGSTAGE